METLSSPPPATDTPSRLYYQLVYTLTDLLPPPFDPSPEALRARNHAAIAKVAALLPINANELDLAAQCIAARAQAEDVLRLIRQNADDIPLVMRLNAQYSSMLRTSLSIEGRLMRVQAVRRKREATEGAASEDAWTQHITERSMLAVADLDAERLQAAQPAPAPAPAGTPGAPWSEEAMPENETNSHGAAFETWMSTQLRALDAENPGETGLRERVRATISGSPSVKSREAGQKAAANGRLNPGQPPMGHVARRDPRNG